MAGKKIETEKWSDIRVEDIIDADSERQQKVAKNRQNPKSPSKASFFMSYARA